MNNKPIKYKVTVYVSGLKTALDSFQAIEDGFDLSSGVRWFKEPNLDVREYPAADFVFVLGSKRVDRIKQLSEQDVVLGTKISKGE